LQKSHDNIKQGAFSASSDPNKPNFAALCNLSISEKKITFESGSVVMAGFRDYTLDKYIQKLTENGYTAVVFVQEMDTTTTPKPTIKRVLHTVYSPGTVVSYDTEVSTKITNHIMCIWFDTFMPVLQKTGSNVLEKSRETLVFGVAVANIFTGKTAIFEHQTPFYVSPTTFDELERYISIYSPSEIIVLSPFDAPVIELGLLQLHLGLLQDGIGILSADAVATLLCGTAIVDQLLDFLLDGLELGFQLG
jgi:DNA mismatch repair ATPase MutS